MMNTFQWNVTLAFQKLHAVYQNFEAIIRGTMRRTSDQLGDGGCGLAQEAASKEAVTKKPEFEVATIKPVETPKGSRTVILAANHGTAKVEFATLRQLIVQAYGFNGCE